MYPPLKERICRELDFFFLRIKEKLERELPNQHFFSVPEIAKIFGVSRKTVRRWIRYGKLEAIKVEGAWRVSREQLVEFAGKRSNWLII